MIDSEARAYSRFAEYYDLMVGNRDDHVSFYSGLLDPAQSSLLDLGCGTGAITTRVARALRAMRRGQAVRVVGVDGSRAMLDVAASRDASIEWVEGDLRSPPIEGRFDLAISCYNTLQHIETADLQKAFERVRALLAAAACFAFDIYRPNLTYIRVPQRNRLARELVHPDGRRLEIREDTDYCEEGRFITIVWDLIDPARKDQPPLAQTRYRMWQHEPGEVEQALAHAGFEIVERFGDLDRSVYGQSSKKQVTVCRAI